jgi:membrane associated rhomboid family serine protease
MRYKSFSYDKNAPIWILVIINLLVFIATIVSHNLVYLLGLQPATFLEKPWTIITNMFVHADIWHILFNMITLYFYGGFLSQLIGTGGFLLVYFFGGILGNVFFMLLSPAHVTGIGASGAIFALGGALAILMPRLRVYIFPIPVAMPLWAAVIGGFIIISLVPGIAWQAHLGGLIFGLIAGYFYRKKARPLLY